MNALKEVSSDIVFQKRRVHIHVVSLRKNFIGGGGTWDEPCSMRAREKRRGALSWREQHEQRPKAGMGRHGLEVMRVSAF